MALEKRWLAVQPTIILSNGTPNGALVVPYTGRLKVKQILILSSNTQPSKKVQIKRITSDNQIEVGHPDRDLRHREDLSAYLVVDNASYYAEEQPRPNISPDDIIRAVFDEEPTVALRTLAVDELGEPINSDNPLPVSATLSVDSIDFPVAEAPTIQNIIMPLANTEYSVSVPAGTKGIQAKLRNLGAGPAKLQLSYSAGQSGTNFVSIAPGAWYKAPAELNTLLGLTLYVQASKANQVLEVEFWV